MSESLLQFPDPFEALSRLPALVVGPTYGLILTPDGEVIEYDLPELRKQIREQAFLICNLPVTTRRLGKVQFRALDLLELFAFVRPAEFCLPLALGVARALDLPHSGDSLEEDALVLLQGAQKLFQEVKSSDYAYGQGIGETARQMAEAGWAWGPLILGALDKDIPRGNYAVWDHLPEWEERAPPPPPGIDPVSEKESLARLHDLLGPDAEERRSQQEYAALTATAFDVPENADEPKLVLAEAGTGIGKTLGYIAPASLWAEKNDGTVWLATYTKNLQRQLDQELNRLYPDAKVKNEKVVIRKGRENYLCLLNLQELSHGAAQPQGRILLGLVSRWARYSRDGDMIGGDFPAWLGENFGSGRLAQLTDRRGECVYSACAHYRRCFIERAQRKAKYADLVIANHALVMVQSATRKGDPDLPSRYVFDEGHHLFDAADSAFSAHLTGQEGLELRRWIRGAEESGRRGKGLKGRLEDLISDDDDARQALEQVISAARCLPADGWHNRLIDGAPFGPAEAFLSLTRQQTFARSDGRDQYHSLETPADHFVDGLLDTGAELFAALNNLVHPLKRLSATLLKKLDDEAADLDSSTRARLDSVSRTLTRRADIIAQGWLPMLESLKGEKQEGFVDWFELNRAQGRELDAGMHRHYVDPSQPFVETVLKPAHGVVITSATLRDRVSDSQNPDIEWHAAEVRTGAAHLISTPRRQSLKSPFNYAEQSRIFIVNDMNRRSLDQLAAAYRELMLASGGGALGIFTAISRLRGVHQRLSEPMEQNHIPLYAQHVDPINVSTLIDIFREVENSCLLGTDAVRDGVDVPGNSLRLCIFDKVPWPRPTILHKARRAKFGKQTYDDLITRLRLKQAYGRLIRRASDRGVFIMLDGATPTRLLSAFPEDVVIERIGLADAIRKTRDFLAENTPLPPQDP
ncbi:ATP-dependent DNA helicase [Paremcibacter congregatus]|uniref:Helicase n=1 Tax=Paremcibacter congregatus TaxID=2043170 RepID=A0A2G4YPG6_9PROT|nr:ATP-dependent DNA helicase [Paremcibacter congregatus]PHZ84198.1 helicase [Paremcibacter congregatus]QDE29067.1 ATP-dependent DNA helicase [Paremcibacter congregatus]